MDPATWNGSTTRPVTLSSPTNSQPNAQCISNLSTKKTSPLVKMTTVKISSPVVKLQNQELPSPSLAPNPRTVSSVPKSMSLSNNTIRPPRRATRDSLCAMLLTWIARNATLHPRVSTMLFTDGRTLPQLDKDHRRRQAQDMAAAAVQTRMRSGIVDVVFRP